MNRPAAVRHYLLDLQARIVEAFEGLDRSSSFVRRELDRGERGLSRPWGMEDGAVLERVAVHFIHTRGPRLPEAASRLRSDLVGRPFEGVSLSLIVHPRNPYVPTTHANLRFFQVGTSPEESEWWFGGGFDLTPYYGFEEDAVHWHESASQACAAFDPGLYRQCKEAADEYFYLPHRREARGIGGLFFDDYHRVDFEMSFAFVRSVGDHFLPAYLPIVAKRSELPYGERQRRFQALRRGRYVEFNLLWDRGTRFGIDAGGPADSVLASLPPGAAWMSDWEPAAGSPEERLTRDFLSPRDWIDVSR